MNNISNFIQKYRQAPWRVQRQWVVLFLLGIVLTAMVAGAYLYVTSRTALAGREIQILETDIISNQRKNVSAETQLATLTSIDIMEQRAIEMGFEPVAPDAIVYITVPGYTSDPPLELANTKAQLGSSIILAEYKESLFDWFARRLQNSAGGQP